MAKVELKQPIVQEISETIKDAQSLVVVDYRGLTVAEDTQLRKNLREAGVTYKVYKNTLVNRAIEGTEFESLKDVLEGPNAFAVSTEDATAPARVLAEFAKKAPSLEIKAGVVEGTYYDAEGMKQIASVPSREVLLSKLLGSLQSPITNLARVLNQIAEKGGAADAAADAAPAEEAPAQKQRNRKPILYQRKQHLKKPLLMKLFRRKHQKRQQQQKAKIIPAQQKQEQLHSLKQHKLQYLYESTSFLQYGSIRTPLTKRQSYD